MTGPFRPGWSVLVPIRHGTSRVATCQWSIKGAVASVSGSKASVGDGLEVDGQGLEAGEVEHGVADDTAPLEDDRHGEPAFRAEGDKAVPTASHVAERGEPVRERASSRSEPLTGTYRRCRSGTAG